MARPGTRIPAVTLYAEKEEIKSAFGIATKSWICASCRKEFSLLESLGDLGCWQHPGFIQEDGVWSCCGQKIFPSKWNHNQPILRMYDNKHECYPTIPSVRGCQRCDHKTSGDSYTHKDTTPLSELSAILPFINKERPFIIRKGFKNGHLIRCDSRQIIVPKNAVKITYQNESGAMVEWDVPDDNPIQKEDIPFGIEHKAETIDGNNITIWWPQKNII